MHFFMHGGHGGVHGSRPDGSGKGDK
jgi:hypothetical protein